MGFSNNFVKKVILFDINIAACLPSEYHVIPQKKKIAIVTHHNVLIRFFTKKIMLRAVYQLPTGSCIAAPDTHSWYISYTVDVL